MIKTRRKYVHSFIDDRFGKAKARFYFRRRGFKQIALPGPPGSPEFEASYQAALAGAQPLPSIVGAKRIRAGSIDALVIAYLNSPAFVALAESTRENYRIVLEQLAREHGDKPLGLLTRKHLQAMLARKAATPSAANLWLRLVKVLMHFAMLEGMRADDPTRDIGYIKSKASGGFHCWSEHEIAQFEQFHPIGTKPRLALALMLYTAQRRSDVVRMGRQHVRNGMVHVRQQKTGAVLAIPVHPALAAILEAAPGKHLTLITTEHGTPFSPGGFSNWFRVQCDAAGLPKECSAHGLRKAACRRLAEAGCSANVIAAISGHATLREVERYTKAADQERMARQGMAAMIQGQSGGH